MLLGEKKKPKRFLGYATFYVRNKILKENKQAFSHLCKKKKNRKDTSKSKEIGYL